MFFVSSGVQQDIMARVAKVREMVGCEERE